MTYQNIDNKDINDQLILDSIIDHRLADHNLIDHNLDNSLLHNQTHKNNILSFINSLNECPIELVTEDLNNFEMFLITDSKSKPAYVSDNLTILKTYGNGLCLINALLVSIFGKWWQRTDEIDLWIRSLLATFDLDPTFVPIFNLYLYGIDIAINSEGIDEFDVIKFLNANKRLLFILSFNILKFAVTNYDNMLLNKVFNKTDRLCMLETGVAFNPKKQKFYAIDGQVRNFIMAIMGIEKVVVYQNKTESKHRRHTNTDFNLKAIDYEGEYAGFEIEQFNNIHCGGIIGEVLLFTHNAEHYDAFFDTNTFQTCLAQTDNFESLPKFVHID